MKLTEKENYIRNGLYWYYQNFPELTLIDLARLVNRDRTALGYYYKQRFSSSHLELVKLKNKVKESKLTEASKAKLSSKLKGRKKPQRSEEHRKNLNLAFKGRTYKDRFGNQANAIRDKIRKSLVGKKHVFKNKDTWRKNLSASLKGRNVWNKGVKGSQKAWNKVELSNNETNSILNLYTNNKSSEYIAKQYNISKDIILRVLKENGIKLRNSGDYIRGKTLVERFGEEKAREIIKKFSERNKSRKVTWGNKISEGIRNYYKNNPVSDERRIKGREITKRLWSNPEYRERLIRKHREYIKNNPLELQRLKEICPTKGPSSVEVRMLTFLKQHFKENKDFYYDTQDLTGKTFYRPDFQFPERNIIIEVYGHNKHFTKEGKQKDKIREYYLKKAGWKVYKLNFLEVKRDFLFERTKERVMEILKNG